MSTKTPETPVLRPIAELTCLRVSKSSKDNLRRVSPGGIYDFAEYAKKNGGMEPYKVSQNSPQLILNFLAEHTNLNKLEERKAIVARGEQGYQSLMMKPPELKSIDTLNGYIQGLSQLFEEHGHVGNFTYDPVTGVAIGNPTEGVQFFQKFRRRYRALLAEMGLTEPKQATPLGVDELLSLSNAVANDRTAVNLEMYAVCALGTNLILRFDEVTKLRMEGVTLYRASPRVKIILSEKCKNSTYTREYIREPWGARLAGCLKLDSCFSLLSWILFRGDTPGYLFPSIRGGRMNFEKPIESASFVSWLQQTLLKQGEGQTSVKGFRLHSLKRGGVQIWKSLGRDDRWIMRRVHATGFPSYQRYAYSGKGAWPSQLPEFSTMHAAEDFVADSLVSVLLNETDLCLPEIACIDEGE